MRPHVVTKRLSNKGFIPWNLNEIDSVSKKFNQANMQVWRKGNRVIVVKEYSSQPHFSTWIDNQIPISYLYDILESKSKNNLYFLLILNWKVKLDSDIVQQINRTEKDELVCRKYVLSEDTDLERVPFLQEGEIYQSLFFNYEQKFKETLSLNDIGRDTVIQKLVNTYFHQDYFSEGKVERQKRIKKIITGEKENET